MLQANATIIAFLGVFIIYKMQVHHGAIETIKGALFSDRGMHSQPDVVAKFEAMKSPQKKQYVDNLKVDHPYLQLYKNWLFHKERIDELKERTANSSIFLVIGMGLDAVFLLLCYSMHQVVQLAEILLAFVIAAFHFVVWLNIAKEIVSVIRDN
jgi:hypothetical protein